MKIHEQDPAYNPCNVEEFESYLEFLIKGKC